MFENFSEGWEIGKAVRKLVYGDKELLIYPVIISIVALLEAILIFASFLFGVGTSRISLIVALFVYYLVVTFSATYLLVAMLLAFRNYTKGKKIGISEALSQASVYSTLIMEWAIFYSIILTIIRLIESQLRGALTRFLFSAVASLGLSIATVFVVPVIIDNQVGPIDAMKKSTDFFIHNIGKTVGGITYTDLYNLMFILGGAVLMLLGAVLALVSPLLTVPIVIIGLVLFVFGILSNYVTFNVFKFVIYEYFNGKPLPAGISKDLIKKSVKGPQSTQASAPKQ